MHLPQPIGTYQKRIYNLSAMTNKNINMNRLINLSLGSLKLILAFILISPSSPSLAQGTSRCNSFFNRDRFTRRSFTRVSDAYLLRSFWGAIPVYASIREKGIQSLDSKARILDSLVQIQTSSSPGTGVIISSSGGKAIILTSKHVIDKNSPGELMVKRINGESLKVLRINKLRDIDLAEVVVAVKGCVPTIPLKNDIDYDAIAEKRKQSINKDIYVIGFPAVNTGLQVKFVPAKALLQSYNVDARANGYGILYRYEHGLETEIGMSGSPVLDQDGYVVGIHGQVDIFNETASSARHRTGYGLAVPTHTWVSSKENKPIRQYSGESVDLALQGSYQISTGQIKKAITSLSKAINQARVEYRQLEREIRLGHNHLNEFLSPENHCKREIANRIDWERLYPSGLGTFDTGSTAQTKYDTCLHFRRSWNKRHELEYKHRQVDNAELDAHMASRTSFTHLLSLRGLGYALNGDVNKARTDWRYCSQLHGHRDRRSTHCNVYHDYFR